MVSTHYPSSVTADEGGPIYSQQQVLATVSRADVGTATDIQKKGLGSNYYPAPSLSRRHRPHRARITLIERGKPQRRHQLAAGELGEHARIDLVGLRR
jgi:hypothetical protein